MRFFFSYFLLPVYVFALSQTPQSSVFKSVLVFICWHCFIYPASNGYNSYFDKDKGSIALLKHPPKTEKSLYWYSLILDALGFLIALWVSIEFALATLVYGFLSKLYSHPSVRLKKYPLISFLVVFIFQGAFVYWISFKAMSGLSMFSSFDELFFTGGLICSCLIGASYPLTQVYQHQEDSERGDKTLSLLLGIKGSFVFSAILFLIGSVLMYRYWLTKNQIENFQIFAVLALPVMLVFLNWYLKVLKNESNADYKNMSIMTLTSGTAMLIYFLVILLK